MHDPACTASSYTSTDHATLAATAEEAQLLSVLYQGLGALLLDKTPQAV
jgi:hypothetical protein